MNTEINEKSIKMVFLSTDEENTTRGVTYDLVRKYLLALLFL